MSFTRNLTRKLAVAALLCTSLHASAAYAGDQADAEAAIAVAKGKLATGDKLGTNRRAPELQEQARAALVEAQELLNTHHKKEARDAAIRAGELADRALVAGDNRRIEAEQTRRLDTQEAAITAQQSAASANMRANSAEAMGNAANQRAATAEQEAANANARTEALRMAPVSPQQTTTTIITEHERAAPVVVRKPLRKARKVLHRAPVKRAVLRHSKTTTVVTTSRR